MSYSACADAGPEGMHCERRKEHDGPHAALDGDITWTDEFSEAECTMDHQWCNGPDGELNSGEAFGGICSSCYNEKMRKLEKDNE